MNINLTPIFEALIALMAAIITYKLIPWIKARTTETQQANLRAVIKTLVFAAEQLYQGEGRGKEKLAYVKGRLEDAGYTIDTDAIEAAVGEYFNFVAEIETEIVETGDDDNNGN